MGTKYSKAPIFYNALCVPSSTFGTQPNEIHKIRRGAMNPSKYYAYDPYLRHR
jgi:hypothetical protein